MNELIKTDALALTPENAKALAERPLLAVPAELRPAVYRLWKLHEFLFPTAGSITTAVAMDLDSGLARADAEAILQAMAQPESRAKYRFASDFMTDLAFRAKEAKAAAAKVAAWCADMQERCSRADMAELERLRAAYPQPVAIIEEEIERRLAVKQLPAASPQEAIPANFTMPVMDFIRGVE